MELLVFVMYSGVENGVRTLPDFIILYVALSNCTYSGCSQELPLRHSINQSEGKNAGVGSAICRQFWQSGKALPLFTLTFSPTQQLSPQYPVLTPLSQPTNMPLNRKAKLAFLPSAAAGAFLTLLLADADLRKRRRRPRKTKPSKYRRTAITSPLSHLVPTPWRCILQSGGDDDFLLATNFTRSVLFERI